MRGIHRKAVITIMGLSLFAGAGAASPAMAGDANDQAFQQQMLARQDALESVGQELVWWEAAAEAWAINNQGIHQPWFLYNMGTSSAGVAASACGVQNIVGLQTQRLGSNIQVNGRYYLPVHFTPPYQGAWCAVVYPNVGTYTTGGANYPEADVIAYFVPGERSSQHTLLRDEPAQLSAMEASAMNSRILSSSGAVTLMQKQSAGQSSGSSSMTWTSPSFSSATLGGQSIMQSMQSISNGMVIK